MCFQEWEERAEEGISSEPQQKKDEERRRIREEKARQARLAAIKVLTSESLHDNPAFLSVPPFMCGFMVCPVSPSCGNSQELQQKRAQRVAEVQQAAEAELESLRPTAATGRKKPPRICQVSKSPASLSNNSLTSPTDVKAQNTGLYTHTDVKVTHFFTQILSQS